MTAIQSLVINGAKPAPLCLLVHAWEKLIGPVIVRSGNLIAQNGAPINGASDLQMAVQIPGAGVKDLSNSPDGVWMVDADQAASIDAAGSVADLAPLVGAANARVCESFAMLWEKCRGTAFWTSAQIDRAQAVCRLGLLCFPASNREVLALSPTAAPDLQSPLITDATREAYTQIVATFKAARSAYVRSAYADAAAAAEASARNVAMWDAIYSATKAVADLPGTVVGAVGDAALGVAGSFFKRTWYLLAIAAAVAFLWFNRTALASAASRKAMKAIGVPDAA